MLRYLISILIGGILLLIFKDWLGISRKHPPRKKAACQPDSAPGHEPETITQSMQNDHEPATIAQSTPDGHEKAEHNQLRPVSAPEQDFRDAVSHENGAANFTRQASVIANDDSVTGQQDISLQPNVFSLHPEQNEVRVDPGPSESKQSTAQQASEKQQDFGNSNMLSNLGAKLQDQTSEHSKSALKAAGKANPASKPQTVSKRSPLKSWFSFKRSVNWSMTAQPLNWSNLLTTKIISNAAYLEQLQQWDRHLSMVVDHDEIATQARQNFSDAQKNAFFQDPFPGLRFLAYEMAKTYSWYSHGADRTPSELAMLSKELKGIIQLHERATQLLQGDIGERRVYQLLQEFYPHEELLDSLNLPFDYYKKQNTAAVNQIDIVLITRNGVLIPEVKNYQGLALQLTRDGDFIIAYPNGYCEQIKNAAGQLSNHEHAVSRLLFEDANARQILMNAQPVIHSMFVAANPDQATMPAPGMRNRLYSLSQLDQFAKFKAKRPLTGLEQRYLKELLASRGIGEREYEQPFIINLAKLERQLLAMVALNDQYLNDNSPLTRYVGSDMLTSLHRGNFIDDHCRLR
ncbi:nuclease-related domain-containing protein [Limosilactobacillus mucosae]|uniref:Nuclease-related domain-containing protein n=1 Tax=Limosilactobacillus mucosae TaxID=97478 RepID=A0AAJ1MC58_LIMMU|nr:nuclease-related domain-containing protein [Limosilactobacillus mucosae]MDC2830714.1 nuclease-related domain-containing protein [Limosilactobacillus mucosae]MDC2837629.1 nuclease-related domain-containing protein [Limosilactobacillus mucosae]MDC2849077.1 nuclease-related domain-containing protein [Limosilactobacillus mucosae]